MFPVICGCGVAHARRLEKPSTEPLRPSVEPLALVLLPAAVERESDHDQHHEAQHGEEQREEELDAAHPFILDFNCSGTHKHVRDSATASVALNTAADH